VIVRRRFDVDVELDAGSRAGFAGAHGVAGSAAGASRGLSSSTGRDSATVMSPLTHGERRGEGRRMLHRLSPIAYRAERTPSER
jgi:hypothetical protein